MVHPTLQLRTAAYRSTVLGGEQAYAYYLPEARDAGVEPLPLFVLLHGLNGSHLDWSLHTRVSRYAAQLGLCIVLFDGGNGWFADSAEGAYETAFTQEFVPHLRATLPLRPPGAHWGIGGVSMGGYGAVKLALRHPELFLLAVGHSGAYDAPRTTEVHPVFGTVERDRPLRRASDVYRLAEDALCRMPFERPRLLLDCGAQDPALESSRRFHQHLNFVGYQHSYQEMPGHHTWPYFDRALRTALPDVARLLGAIVAPGYPR